MQLIGIVLLLLVGLSGSKDVLGKKRAWLLPYKRSLLDGPWSGQIIIFKDKETGKNR
jgi:hypothetical protein